MNDNTEQRRKRVRMNCAFGHLSVGNGPSADHGVEARIAHAGQPPAADNPAPRTRPTPGMTLGMTTLKGSGTRAQAETLEPSSL